jgi:ATP-dependent Clp protease ATP-binding subunit ClpB
MRMDRLTTTAQQALAEAQTSAAGRQHAEVGGLHVLAALISDRAGPAGAVLGKIGVEPMRLAQVLEAELSREATVSSGAGNAGRAVVELLGKADAEARRMGDAYVSSEHLLLALADVGGKAKDILSTLGADKSRLEKAVKEIRAASGRAEHHGPERREQFRSAQEVRD